jgi:hypothetical protein
MNGPAETNRPEKNDNPAALHFAASARKAACLKGSKPQASGSLWGEVSPQEPSILR